MSQTADFERIRELATEIRDLAIEKKQKQIVKLAEALLAALSPPGFEDQPPSDIDKHGAKPDDEGRQKAARLIIDIYR